MAATEITNGPNEPGASARSATGQPGRTFARALFRSRKGTAGAILLLLFVVLAIFPGEIAPYSPTYLGFARALGPSGAHWLGTTSEGQDIFSQLIWGTRQSLIIAVAAGGLACPRPTWAGSGTASCPWSPTSCW
jgi:peptide/nickel transport system permease protein